MCTNVSVPISMIATFPKPLAKSMGLCYNTNNLPRPCITHASTGGISDHRTDHIWLRSGRRQRTRECQRAQKSALFRSKNSQKLLEINKNQAPESVWELDAAGSSPVTSTKIADLTAFSGQIGTNIICHRRLCTVMPD